MGRAETLTIRYGYKLCGQFHKAKADIKLQNAPRMRKGRRPDASEINPIRLAQMKDCTAQATKWARQGQGQRWGRRWGRRWGADGQGQAQRQGIHAPKASPKAS